MEDDRSLMSSSNLGICTLLPNMVHLTLRGSEGIMLVGKLFYLGTQEST
jgi:hypothetical protein